MLAVALAIAALWVKQLPFAPFTVGDRHPIDALLIAIVLGAIVRNTMEPPAAFRAGIRYAVHGVLPAAIVLMGAKLDFYSVMAVSWQALVLNVACVAVALLGTVWLCKRLGVAQKLGLLIGVGTAICGGTAIAVTAPLVEANENETAFSITAINLFGLAWIFVFPLIGAAFAMDSTSFGMWAGSSIHATPQVLAAGAAHSSEAFDIALIVKLVRVLLLAPCVVIIGIWYARQKRRRQEAHVAQPTGWTKLFPPFVIGFLALALAQTLHLLPSFTLHLEQSILWESGDVTLSMGTAATKVSGFLVTVAMAGVGLGVNLRGLVHIGPRAFYAGLASAVLLAAFSLTSIQLFF